MKHALIILITLFLGLTTVSASSKDNSKRILCGKVIDKVEITNATYDYKNTSLSNGLYFYALRSKDEELQRGKFLIVK